MNCKSLARKKLNNDSKFAMFYISVICIALGTSLYVNRLNGGWNHAVFTFPPEVQKVLENGTAVMEVQWRWLPETLEMIVKVNDDDYNETYNNDWLGLLFDSDHSGSLTTNVQEGNDYGVFMNSQNRSGIMEHCFYFLPGPHWGSNAVMWTLFSGSPFVPILRDLNNTYCVYDKGYTFYLSIPREIIDVSPPTPIHISFMDYEAILYADIHHEYAYQEVIAADFEG